jgi:hypothetical protein
MSDFNIEDYKLQAYLLSCAEEIINICNRTVPPSEDVRSKWHSSLAQGGGRYGGTQGSRFYQHYNTGYAPNPQPVVLKKIVNDAEDDVDANLMSNALTPEDSTKFVTDLPDDIRRNLNPYVTVYKTFIQDKNGERGPTVDIEIATQNKGSTEFDPTRRQMKFIRERNVGNQTGVALRDLEIIRLGGNPAEVDSNIQVRLNMYATNMADFFARQKDETQVRYPKRNPTDPNSLPLTKADFNAEMQDQIENGVAWIDLIKIKLDEESNKHIDNYYEKMAAAHNVDTQENVYDSMRDTLAYNEFSQRIKLEVGYSIPISVMQNYTPADQALYGKLIGQQKEIYYLSLVSNQINFNEDGTVEISCNYIASCGTAVMDRSTDLLFEPWMYERTQQLHDDKCRINRTMPTEDVNDKLEDLATAKRSWQLRPSAEWYEKEKELFGDDGAPDGTELENTVLDPFLSYIGSAPPNPLNPKNLLKNSIRGPFGAVKNHNQALAHQAYKKAIEDGETGKLEDDEDKREALIKIDTSLKKLRKIQSGLLINGLYGGQLLKRAEVPGFNPANSVQYDSLTTIQKKSRVYYHPVRDEDVVDRIASKLSRTSDSATAKPYVANMGDLWFYKDSGQAGPGETHQQVKQKDLERFHDRGSSAEVQTQGGGTNVIKGYETDLEFTFLGDIIEVALEVLVSNNRCGKQNTSTTGYTASDWRWKIEELPPDLIFAGATVADVEKTAFARPFYWDFEQERNMDFEAYAEAVKNKEWAKDLADIVGEVACSYITYNSPAIPSDEIKISLADLPISMLEFKKWFSQNVETRTSLTIKQYLEMLLRWATRLCDKAMTFNKDQVTNVEPPQLLINKYFVNHYDPQFLSVPGSLPDSVSMGGVRVPSTIDKAYNTRDVERIFQFVKSNQTEDNDSFTIYNTKVLTLLSQQNQVVVTAPPTGQSRLARDRKQNVPHIFFGDATTGILQQLSFQREDMPGLREARLFEGTNMSGMSMLREKYNAELRLIGTSFFKPGSVFYVDPDPLNLGYGTQDVTSPARELGLGGYYFTTRVVHNLDFTSQGHWETRIESKWNSFGDKKLPSPSTLNPRLRKLEKQLYKPKCITSFKNRLERALDLDDPDDQSLLQELAVLKSKP